MYRSTNISRLLSCIPIVLMLLACFQKEAAAQPNLLIDVTVDDTSPDSLDVFKYRIRYRCASIVEHCYNSSISFELPPSLHIVSIPLTAGNVAAVDTSSSASGTLFNIDLASPPSAGAPPGALAAGSTGTLTVAVQFKCVDEAGVSPPGTINFVQLPEFYAENQSGTPTTVTAAAPADVNIPDPLAACQAPSPPPTSEFDKKNIYERKSSAPGNRVDFLLEVPEHTGPVQIVENVPEGLRMYNVDVPVGWGLEVMCGGTWYSLGNEWLTISSWYNDPAHSVGNVLNDDTGNPTGCVLQQIGPFNDGSTAKISDIEKVRITSPAGLNPSDRFSLGLFADEDYPVGSYVTNCVTIDGSNPEGWDSPECAEVLITDKPAIQLSKTEDLVNSLGSTAITTQKNLNTLYPNLYKDPMDIQWRIGVSENIASGSALNGFVVEDLLPLGLDFVTDPDKPNYWVVLGSQQSAGDPDCEQPTFTRIPDYNGTGQVLLRWEFPNCIFPGDPTGDPNNNYGTLLYGISILFSTRYNLEIPLPFFFQNVAYVETLDGSSIVNSVDLQCADSIGYVRDYDVPTSGGDLNSAKYVKGLLDTQFTRFPQVGDTDTSGVGVYEMYIYNHKFETIKELDVVDILPFIGDEDLLTGLARGSEWSMELASAITVERLKAGSGLQDATADLGANGVMYSTSTDPCYLDGSSQIKLDGTEAAPASCSGAFAPGGTAAGARSFAFRWSNDADPLVFGEYLKITVNVKQLTGEADFTNGEISWNSFGYTATQSDDFELLSTEPIKVGLKMIDPGSFAAIGNYVWHDENFNGLQDNGEHVFQGVTVCLYNADGSPVTETVTIGGSQQQVPVCTTTDANGLYCFNGLAPNTGYIVSLNDTLDYMGGGPLTNFVLTNQNAGDDALDSDAALGNLNGMATYSYPEIAATSPAAGEKDDSFDFGFYKPATVGNFVWYDNDGQGDQSAGEAGVAGVTVELLDESGGVVATQTTNANGYYLFTGVTPGIYSVRFSNLPAGYVFTGKGVTGSDANDSDANSLGETDAFQVNSCDAITTMDAGLRLPPPNPATISGTVWDDLDCAGGTRGANDPGVEGVTVQLLDEFGFVLQTATTDENGDYIFENLDPDATYSVAVVPPNTSTTFTASGPDMVFDPATGVTVNTITPSTVCSPISTAEVIGAAGNTSATFDVNGEAVPGFCAQAFMDQPSVGDIFTKINDPSTIPFTNTTLTNAEVQEKVSQVLALMLHPDYAPSPLPTDPEHPFYNSIQLAVWTYTDDLTGISPNPTSWTGADGNTYDTPDIYTWVSNGALQPVPVVWLAPPNGSTQIEVLLDPCPEFAVTGIDAGICSLLSLGNLVFNDANNNGTHDAGEGVFPNITVYLIDSDGTTYLDTTVTDANGRYVFTALQAGGYIVEVEVPAGGYMSSTDIASTPVPNQTDSDDNGTGTADSGRVRSNTITLEADGGDPAGANWGEADHGVLIAGRQDPTPDGKAYYTVDFGFRQLPAVAAGDFDLALRKTVASQSDTPLMPGTSTVTFELKVYNQGDIAADSIELTDYIPAGLTLADPNWTMGGSNAVRTLSVANGDMAAALAPDDSITVQITFSVDAGVEGVITNHAEISRATDESGNPVTDIDSTPDSDPNNETGVINDEVDDDGTLDEDDHDPECISVPVELCEGQSVTLEAELAGTYQWYKGGLALAGENGQSLTVTFDASGNFEGDYHVVLDGGVLGSCGSQNCCPVTLVTGTCPPDCPTDRCIPGTMMKVAP